MRIAFIGDQKGKVQHNRYKVFCKYIQEHSFKFMIISDPRLQKTCKKYDAVYYSSLSLFLRRRISHRNLFASATSWKCINDKRNRAVLKKLGVFRRVSANNVALVEALRKYRKDVEYLPNGVEVDLFSPGPSTYGSSRIRIGWVGNRDRKEKNYRSILSPVRKCIGRPLKIKMVLTHKSDSSSKCRSVNSMCGFYRKMQYYLVTSSYEGTPNPALEAASCGVPLIATRVGNMPELIINGVNGYFVKCKVDNIVRQLKALVTVSAEEYESMRQSIRGCILKEWSWEDRCKSFSKFFSL